MDSSVGKKEKDASLFYIPQTQCSVFMVWYFFIYSAFLIVQVRFFHCGNLYRVKCPNSGFWFGITRHRAIWGTFSRRSPSQFTDFVYARKQKLGHYLHIEYVSFLSMHLPITWRILISFCWFFMVCSTNLPSNTTAASLALADWESYHRNLIPFFQWT